MSPLTCGLLVLCTVIGILVGDIRHQRILWVRVSQHGENGQKNLRDCQGGRPVLLQNIKTDESRCVDIWMVNLRLEDNSGWLERIVDWELNVHLEDTSSIWGIVRAEEDPLPHEYVVLLDGSCTAVERRVIANICEFTCDSLRGGHFFVLYSSVYNGSIFNVAYLK